MVQLREKDNSYSTHGSLAITRLPQVALVDLQSWTMLDFAFCSFCLSSRTCYHWNPLNVTHLKDVVTMHVDYGQQTYRVGGIMWEMAAFPSRGLNQLPSMFSTGHPIFLEAKSMLRGCKGSFWRSSSMIHPRHQVNIKLVSYMSHVVTMSQELSRDACPAMSCSQGCEDVSIIGSSAESCFGHSRWGSGGNCKNEIKWVRWACWATWRTGAIKGNEQHRWALVQGFSLADSVHTYCEPLAKLISYSVTISWIFSGFSGFSCYFEICTDSGAVADLAAALSGPEQRWAALALYHLARGDGRDRRDRRDGRDGKVQLLCTGEGLDG